jgi:maltose/maltodextrin transport system substrate-binding protein
MLSSMIDALCRHSGLTEDPGERTRAIDIACRMADWMISQSQSEGTVLAHFPPTYWGDRRDISVKNAGLNMLRYPSDAAMAYFNLADALERAGKAYCAKRYRSEGFAIVSTYVRLQEKDGTWPLKVREGDGKPTKDNRLVPERHIFVMFDRAIELKGDGKDLTVKALEKARAAAFGFLERGPFVTWNWDGQFEDMDPMPPYKNLQKGAAIDAAAELFKLGRNELALEIVNWCEDQFTVWGDPYPHMDWKNWKMPTALEQYDYYTPIDASMADMVRGFMMAYKATGDRLYKAKALALANCIVRYQRDDGTIPTYFDSRRGSDWANCMIYVATVLETVEE